MAPTKVATKTTQESAKRTSANGKTSKGFTDDEKAAMRERARELKAEAAKADGEKELLTAIAKMEEPARSMAKRLHALIKATAPALAPKTWYGMPAYANDGNVVCFFKKAGKFKARYSNTQRLATWLGDHSLPISVEAGRPAIIGLIVDGPRGRTVLGTHRG
jgi:uncharacterized protein YdhG (YjbR/CyaY superfamily)